MRKRSIALLATSFVLVAVPGAVRAQRSALREVRDQGSAGVTFIVAEPLGPFRRGAGTAPGLDAFGAFNLGRSGLLALRVEGAYLVYGHDHNNGLATDYSIGTLGVGPQLTLGRELQLYGFATVGGSVFYTNTSYAGYCGCYGDETVFDDAHVSGATQLGAGLQIGLGRRGRGTPVALDLGVRDLRHGRVRYVPAGGVTPNADGSLTVRHVESPVRMRIYQIGVSIGLRY